MVISCMNTIENKLECEIYIIMNILNIIRTIILYFMTINDWFYS